VDSIRPRASIVCVAVVALLVVLAQRGSPARRAALFASATAVMWALEATFIKATTDTISTLGFGGAFTRWPVYALIVGGVVGLLCEQAALHVGPLSVSQTFIVIVDPIVSVALGIWIYRERLHHGALHLTIGVVAFAENVVILRPIFRGGLCVAILQRHRVPRRAPGNHWLRACNRGLCRAPRH